MNFFAQRSGLCPGAILSGICLALLCSCTTQNSIRPDLPAEASFKDTVSRGDPLLVNLSLETGEKLLFMVDTGCPVTVLDKSLEPKLGKRLGTGKIAWEAYGERPAGIYAAPKLYLGHTRLLTGDRVNTDGISATSDGVPLMGILGLDCLRHYCLQLDFTANKMRFLDPDHLETNQLGRAFPLDSFFGGIFTYADVLDMNQLFFRTDTGMFGAFDFVFKSKLLRWELREQKPFGQWETSISKGDTLYSKVAFDGGTYTNFVLIVNATNGVALSGNPTERWRKPKIAGLFTRIEFGGETYTNVLFVESRSTWLTENNIIGLRFLARNLVTFNFPKRRMYLKHESIEPGGGTNTFILTPAE